MGINAREVNNYMHDISAGKIERKSEFHKFGRGVTTASPTTVWTTGGVYVNPPETGIKVFLSSTSALDTAQKIKISGEDKHKKLQSEVITSDGTTPVSSVYDYSRTFRMSILDGPINAGTISLKDITGTTTYAEIDFDADGDGQGQTEMCLYTVPAGHQLLIDSIHASSFSNDETNIILSARDWAGAASVGGTNPPIVTKFNEQIYRNSATMPQNPPRKFGELVDLEARSYNDGGTGFASVMLDGVLEQLNSVPVDIEGYSAIAGDESIAVLWDEQTPAEVSDMKGYEVLIHNGTVQVKSILTSDNSVSFDGLENGTEYTVTLSWVGYDNLRGTALSSTVTPGYTPVVIPYVSSLSGLSSPDGKYVVSDDDGLTFSEEQAPGLTGENITVGTYSDGTIIGITSTGQFGEYDGSWNFTATAFEEFGFGNDILYRYNNTAAESKVGSGAWTATNIGGEAHGIGTYSGQHAIVSSNEIKLGDGVTFDTNIGNGGYSFDDSTADNDRVITIHGIDTTTVGFSIYDGTWTEATTTITVVEGDWDSTTVQEFGGDYFMTALSAAYDNGMFYKSSDNGDNWVSQTLPGTGLVPFELSRKGTRLFMTLFDGDFKGYVSYTDDGLSWSTPVYVSDLIPRAIV